MKNRIKKIITVFLLALIIMPMIFSASFIIRLKIAQHEAKEKLEEGLLQTLVLTSDEFAWFKKNKEISIDGRLFDIKSFSEMEGRYVFTGVFDDEETELNKKLSDNLGKDNKLHDQLTGLFQLLLSVYSIKQDETSIISNIPQIYRPLILQHISFPFQDILTPPPQLVRPY